MCIEHCLLLEGNHRKLFGPGGYKPFNIVSAPYCIELCLDYLGQDKHEDVLFQEVVL